MTNLIAGLALIFLALVVVLAFVIDLSGGDPFAASPHETPEAVQRDKDAAMVTVRMGRGESVLPQPGIDPEKEVEEVYNKGRLSANDKDNVDADHYLHYELKRGETLSKLATRYLGKSTLWTEIKRHNPEIQDERDVPEGTVIKIPLWLRKDR